jgi:CheY-like chemotaxis protein
MGTPEAVSAAAVLVVDDEPLVLQLMERMLVSAGFHVVAASNGLRALELGSALPVPPAVLVTDLRMVPIDGFDLAKLVVRLWPATRVLFVSGYDPDHTELPGPFLRKPFSPSHLVEAVRELLPSAAIARDPGHSQSA